MSEWTQTASKGSGGDFEKAPAGNQPAALVAIIDMGTQLVKAFSAGDADKEQHRAYFVWELTTEKKKDGSGHVIGLDLNISLNEKAKLRKWIEARIGRQLGESERYDILSELGKPCLLNVVEKKGYPKIDSMGALPKGMPVPEPTYKPFAWHLDQFRQTGKLDFPAWVPWLYGVPLAEHIKRAKEMIPSPGGAPISPPASPTSAPPPPAKPTPPAAPNRPTPPSSDRKFWCAMPDGEVVEFMQSKAVDFLTGKGLNPSTVLVTPDGQDAWKPAEEYGMKTAF